MDDVTFMILKIVVSVAAALVSAYLIPYIRARTSQSTRDSVAEMVEIAVLAAEQTIGDGQGKAKKEEVIAFVSRWLTEHGVKITDEQLDALIESAVYRMKKGGFT